MERRDQRIIHKARALRRDGGVATALCFKKVTPIDQRVATWTASNILVTCPNCQSALRIENIKKRQLAGDK